MPVSCIAVQGRQTLSYILLFLLISVTNDAHARIEYKETRKIVAQNRGSQLYFNNEIEVQAKTGGWGAFCSLRIFSYRLNSYIPIQGHKYSSNNPDEFIGFPLHDVRKYNVEYKAEKVLYLVAVRDQASPMFGDNYCVVEVRRKGPEIENYMRPRGPEKEESRKPAPETPKVEVEPTDKVTTGLFHPTEIIEVPKGGAKSKSISVSQLREISFGEGVSHGVDLRVLAVGINRQVMEGKVETWGDVQTKGSTVHFSDICRHWVYCAYATYRHGLVRAPSLGVSDKVPFKMIIKIDQRQAQLCLPDEAARVCPRTRELGALLWKYRQKAKAAEPKEDTPPEKPQPPPPPVRKPPKLLKPVAPEFPGLCRRQGADGTVKVEFSVDAAGKVRNEKVIESDSECLNEAALEAIRKFKYEPGTVGGKKTVFKGQTYTFEFKLER